jgi:hypothetical protein
MAIYNTYIYNYQIYSDKEVGSFFAKFPHFQLEDEPLLEGGRDVMWASRRYSRRPKPAAADAQD